MKKNYVFLHFPTDLDNFAIDADEFGFFLENLTFTIDRVDCEKDTYLFYTVLNKNQFVATLQTLETEVGQIGVFDIETMLNMLLRDCNAEDATPTNANQNFYGYWNLEVCNISQIQENYIYAAKIMTDYLVNDKNSDAILLDIKQSLKVNRSFLPILVDDWSNNATPQLVLLDYCYNFDTLDNWLIRKQLPRTYNFGDNRHLENHPQYIRGKSPLLGGEGGKKNAEKLLQTAIGDKRKNKDLVNYDIENQCFIWFEYQNESPQNEYHAYHLVKPRTHERDSRAEGKISERIIEIFKYKKIIEHF